MFSSLKKMLGFPDCEKHYHLDDQETMQFFCGEKLWVRTNDGWEIGLLTSFMWNFQTKVFDCKLTILKTQKIVLATHRDLKKMQFCNKTYSRLYGKG